MADLNCCFCGASLKGHIMIGAGDGTGSRFACKPCACENGIQTCGECARHNILPMNRAKWHKAWREPCAECAAKDAEIARLRAMVASGFKDGWKHRGTFDDGTPVDDWMDEDACLARSWDRSDTCKTLEDK